MTQILVKNHIFHQFVIGNETCRYTTIDMSPGLEYYIQNCRGPSIPTSILRQSSDHSIVAVLESNEGYQSLLNNIMNDV